MRKNRASLLLFLSTSFLAMEKIEETTPLLADIAREEESSDEPVFIQNSTLGELPNELLLNIFTRVINLHKERSAKIKQLKQLPLVCRKFNFICNSSHFAYDMHGNNFETIAQLYTLNTRLSFLGLLAQKRSEFPRAIHFAILEENRMMIRDILLLGFSTNHVYEGIKYKATALCRAAGLNKVKAIKTLLEQPDADPNISDQYGDTPLMITIKNDKKEAAKALLEDHRIDLNRTKLVNNVPLSALQLAVELQRAEIVEMIAIREEQLRRANSRFCDCCVQ